MADEQRGQRGSVNDIIRYQTSLDLRGTSPFQKPDHCFALLGGSNIGDGTHGDSAFRRSEVRNLEEKRSGGRIPFKIGLKSTVPKVEIDDDGRVGE
ncbi:hypothetical protein G6F38_011792 [Rhizopus arrhizus]|nr:hypothetical protein G6F38_011792 [Rhizopus arrhizus]